MKKRKIADLQNCGVRGLGFYGLDGNSSTPHRSDVIKIVLVYGGLSKEYKIHEISCRPRAPWFFSISGYCSASERKITINN